MLRRKLFYDFSEQCINSMCINVHLIQLGSVITLRTPSGGQAPLGMTQQSNRLTLIHFSRVIANYQEYKRNECISTGHKYNLKSTSGGVNSRLLLLATENK